MDPVWGYMGMIDRLTNGDITKQEDVFKLTWVHCLTYLLYLNDKDEYIEKVNKAQEAKQKRK